MTFLKKILCITCITIIFQANAQQGNSCPEDLFPYFDKEKRSWGYADIMGMMVVEPIFTKVSPFSSNKAVVQKGALCGVIDCNGNLIVPVQYKKILNFRYNKAWAMKDSLWCLIDDRGRMVLQPQFSEVYAISGTELTWVKKAGVWGLFNEEKTQYICTPQFTVAQVLSPQCSLVQKDGKLGVLNHVNCGFLLPLNIENVKKVSPHDILFNQNGKWGIFNNAGKVTLNPTYDSLDIIRTGVLIAKLNDQYGLVELTGSVLLPVEYQHIYPYSGGFFRIKKNNVFGYASVKGKVYIKPAYQYAENFSEGSAVVKQKDLFGIINLTDSFVVKPSYSSLQLSDTKEYYVGRSNTLAADLIVKNSNHTFTVNAFDNVLLDDSVTAIRVMKNNKTYFYNGKTHALCFDKAFDGAYRFKNGRAVVGESGMAGLINLNGTYIIQPAYTDIQQTSIGRTTFYLVKKNELKGFLDYSGASVLPAEYEEIVPANPNYLKVKKAGMWSLVRSNGTIVSTQLYSFMSAENVWPIPVQRSKKWCLLNEKGEETKLIKAVSITPDPAHPDTYIIDYGKKKAVLKSNGEIE